MPFKLRHSTVHVLISNQRIAEGELFTHSSIHSFNKSSWSAYISDTFLGDIKSLASWNFHSSVWGSGAGNLTVKKQEKYTAGQNVVSAMGTSKTRKGTRTPPGVGVGVLV